MEQAPPTDGEDESNKGLVDLDADLRRHCL